jgi:hypothetical protein
MLRTCTIERHTILGVSSHYIPLFCNYPHLAFILHFRPISCKSREGKLCRIIKVHVCVYASAKQQLEHNIQNSFCVYTPKKYQHRLAYFLKSVDNHIYLLCFIEYLLRGIDLPKQMCSIFPYRCNQRGG